MALPLQILPQEESFGGKLGTGLGSGIGAGLQNLAQMKLNEISQQKQSALKGRFWQDLGLPASIGSLPDTVQRGLLDRLEGVNIGAQQTAMQPIQQAAQAGQIEQATGPRIGASPAERRFQQDQALKQKKFDLGTRKEAREYQAPFEQSHKKALKTLNRNKQIIEIARSGNLRAGYKQEVLDKIGLGHFWRPIENELAEKNLAAQATNAGAAFNTSRLTNLDVNLYKNALGTLWNTSEGLEAIARVNNLEIKAEEERYKERLKIIKENNGEVPFDIESKVEERVEPKLKHYADKSMQIVTNAAKKIPGRNVAKRKGLFDAPADVPKQGLVAGKSKLVNDKTGETLLWDGTRWEKY